LYDVSRECINKFALASTVYMYCPEAPNAIPLEAEEIYEKSRLMPPYEAVLTCHAVEREY